MKRRFASRCLIWLLPLFSCVGISAEPQPGDSFKEFTYPIRFSEIDAGTKRPNLQARSRHTQSERNLDLDVKGAKKAEVVIEYWGGHIGTGDQSFSVNGSGWIGLPQPQGTPAPPQCYYRTLLKATVAVPIEHLKNGSNSFRFKAGPQICHAFDWGLYWIYSFTVRVYVDGSVPHPEGSIVSHRDGEEIGDDPQFSVSASGREAGISRVDFIGKYEDYNWEGDGVYRQWHYTLNLGQFRNHIGTAFNQPYAVKWDTHWIPDQQESVEIAARITDSFGTTYMTPSVKLALVRQGRSVRMYKASGMPEKFGVRTGVRMSCHIKIPEPLGQARNARMAVSTWSAAHAEDIRLNDRKLADRLGYVHNYSFDVIPIASKWLKQGDNEFSIFSSTREHAAEINWPGPVLLVEFDNNPPRKSSAWAVSGAPMRIPLQVLPGDYDRFDLPVEVELKFPLANKPGPSAQPVRIVEVDGLGAEVDADVPFQFDRASQSAGMLVAMLKGETAAHVPRYFDVYCSANGKAPSVLPMVKATEVDWEGQSSYKIETDAATYVFQKEGAGLASLFDREGKDWISYHPGGGSAGEYRGIPNLGNAFGHAGYTGESGSVSKIAISGPLRIRVVSQRHDGTWASQWDFFPGFARFTMLRNAAPYWFLYEGTPGGKLDTKDGWLRLSNGDRRSLGEPWAAAMEGPRWVAFGGKNSRSFLFIANHQDGHEPDQYWPMEGNMTVFGYGREYNCCHQYLTRAGAEFSVGLARRSEPGIERRKIESIVQDVDVLVGDIERPQ